MFAVRKPDYVLRDEFSDYQRWAEAQRCVDCKAPASERRGKRTAWVTETQCMACFLAHGRPELRGMPGAADDYARYRERMVQGRG